MGFFDDILIPGLAVGGIAVLIGKTAKDEKKRKAENERKRQERLQRRSRPPEYDEILTPKTFWEVTCRAYKSIHKRNIKGKIDGFIVSGTVTSQSGLSTWDFEIDFNDWGRFTGWYEVWSENTDSNIPYHIAGRIKDGVEELYRVKSSYSTHQK